MHYSLLTHMLLLDKYGKNKTGRLEGWKSKISGETRSECQEREEREIERGKWVKRGEGRRRKGRKDVRKTREGEICVGLFPSWQTYRMT